MNYYTIKPPDVLADYVRFFWILESDVSPNDGYVYRSMADGCTEILFHYQGQFDEIVSNNVVEKSFLSGIHGQAKRYRRFRINQNFGIFGVYLYPYTLPTLFNTPASEVSNAMPDLQTFLGHEGNELEEKMMLAINNEQRIDIISDYLKSKLLMKQRDDFPIQSVVKTIIATNGQVNVSDLAGRSFLSVRQFERRFKECSGFSPKLYSRIIRFQSVFHEYNGEKTQLSDVTYKCGYYDQSHFIQEFKEFSGYSPKTFFSGKTTDTTIWTE